MGTTTVRERTIRPGLHRPNQLRSGGVSRWSRPMGNVPVHLAGGSAGRPLDPRVRAFAEPRFGHDFARVRIHTDRSAAASARALGARAYTVGRDVVFAEGEYRPQTTAGRWLLAHELAHVVQQGPRPAMAATSAVGAAPSAAEREARVAADAAVRGGPPIAIAHRVAAPIVQKQDAGPDRDQDQDQPVDPAQAAPTTWSPRHLHVLVESDRARTHDGEAAPRSCFGVANPGAQSEFSRCGRIEHVCTTPATFPFKVLYYVDGRGSPRPQPFRPPTVDVAWRFTSAGGGTRAGHQRDDAPRYERDGFPLRTGFGRTFNVSAPDGGRLHVSLGLVDPDTGTSVTYRDEIECRLSPCV